MVVGTLVASSLVQLVAGACYLLVARALARREVAGEAHLASRAFVAWWTALGAYMVLWSVLTFLAAFGFAPFEMYLLARFVSVPLLMVSVWGLAYHVVFLFTGRASLWRPIAAFYVLCGVAFFLLTLWLERPTTVRVGDWAVEVAREGGSPLLNVLYASIGLPPILASVAYGTLFWRVRDPIQKYRVALVSSSIFLWVGSGLAARVAAGDFAKFFTLTVLGLAAALAVVLAYFPPPRLRLRLDPFDEDAFSRREASRKRRDQERARFEERARGLV